MPNESDRLLSDKDVDAIVEQLEERMTKRFYENLGRGLWGLLLAGLAAALLFIAAWGARLEAKEFWPFH